MNQVCSLVFDEYASCFSHGSCPNHIMKICHLYALFNSSFSFHTISFTVL